MYFTTAAQDRPDTIVFKTSQNLDIVTARTNTEHQTYCVQKTEEVWTLTKSR